MDGRGGRLRVRDTQKWLIRAWVLVKSERREGGQSQR